VFLREKGLATAAKKAGRVAAQGAVSAYVHGGGKIGVLVEVNCETDFVARTEEFQRLVKDLAMQVAAANPRYVRRDEVSEAERERPQRKLGSPHDPATSPVPASAPENRRRSAGWQQGVRH